MNSRPRTARIGLRFGSLPCLSLTWLALLLSGFIVQCPRSFGQETNASHRRPNVLVAICDDQSYPHASAYGYTAVSTPAFDRVAATGVRFDTAITPSPGCSPMRAAFLTGRPIWQIGPAGTHASSFPTHLQVFPELLRGSGYHVGSTGKGWGPGRHDGWPDNPAGKVYNKRKQKSPSGISDKDYAANFEDFLAERGQDQPFCFWYGGHETHRGYQQGIGRQNGINVTAEQLPPFLPDAPEIRSDVADYLYEIQWFDDHLRRMMEKLEAIGELQNTLIVVTSDNGMPFPRAKANVYEYGIHMPLAISWPDRIAAGQTIDAPVSLIDVTRTIVDAASIDAGQCEAMTGTSLLGAMTGVDSAALPTAAFSGRERHSSSRFNSLSYPCRCVRDSRFLYIRNFKPERWPAGTPQKFSSASYDRNGRLIRAEPGPEHGGYHDIDNGPTLAWMIAHRDDPNVRPLFDAAVAKRPAEELYDVVTDPGCLNNLIGDDEFAAQHQRLLKRLSSHLAATGDLRQTDPSAADVWETFPRFSPLRWFATPDWAKQNPGSIPDMPWLEQRRPKAKGSEQPQ
ncbi:sulfatase family protein [Crateriforma conspicua]|uniref:Arylsulfatase n=1 Tax=Crateriforma conspicua TaxID=2527996 RepID=A0A5C5Y9I9_9PLAN|nr:sulfatase [Crateriforma conspicua]QDV65586.1 Arylsulfatase [Crateriforma conspicua]TWT70985.1 Arylsulfatase [Crateriforma conspicua]